MKLPNGRLADLGNKIEEYSLNLNHQEGKNKAILFANKLGITLENAELLKQALKKAAINEDVVIQKTNEYGKYLSKGQVGTVVMEFDGSAFEVEFSHQDGTTYAMETIPSTKLMLLHYELVESVGAVRR